VLAMVPLGGYVKMLDEREGEVAEEESHRAFNRQSLPVRAAVVAAGPLSNLLFAVLAFWLVLMSGEAGLRPLVGEVTPASAAASAGFQTGDEVLAVGERETPTVEYLVRALLAEAGDDTSVPVRVRSESGTERMRFLPGGVLAALADEGDPLKTLGIALARPNVPAVVGELVAGETAQASGLLEGDRILTVDGRPVANWEGFVSDIQAHPGQALALTLERQGRQISLELQVGSLEQGETRIGRIGAGPQVPEGLLERYRVTVKLGPVAALAEAGLRTWDQSVFMVRILGRMAVGRASVKNLGGPISIAQIAGKSASYGISFFLKFLAAVSVSLAVLNLLPVPILDGGHLFFFLIEGIKGRPLSEKAQLRGQQIGLAILLLLMGLAFYVDISRLLG
jgi:regulator of sigma E protease